MNLEPFLKNKSLIGIITIAVAGIFYLVYRLVSNENLFSQLSSEHSFLLLMVIVVASLLVFLVLIILFWTKGDTEKKDLGERKKVNNRKGWRGIATVFIIIIIITCGFIFFIFNDSNSGGFIYKEDFVTNNFPNDWIEGEQNRSKSFVDNGIYVLESNRKSVSRRINVINHFQFSLQNEKQYVIGLDVKNLYSTNDHYFFGGLEWNSDSKESLKYGFYINEKREFSLKLYKHSNEIANFVDWTDSQVININGANYFEVQKKANETIFKINGTVLFSMNDLPVLGEEFGFGIGPGTKMVVDELFLKR